MFYLGTITGASGAYNNQATGLSGIGTFQIPVAVRSLYLVPSASGLLFELGNATGISFLTSAARGAQLAGPNTINGPFRVPGGVPGAASAVTISIYNSAGGFVSCRVYSAPTS